MAQPAAGMSKQMRLSLDEVIQLIMQQKESTTAVATPADWPPIAWVIMQQESSGMSREEIAASLGVEEADIAALICDLIQDANPETSLAAWHIGVVALKTAIAATNQVLTTNWDQLEAMAIEKTAMALQNLSHTTADPMKLIQIAAMANKATRRKQGEIAPGTAPKGIIEQPQPGVEIEMKSGDVGSITLRFGPRVIEQLQKPGRIIDAEPNREPARHIEMLRLKDTRTLADSLDLEAEEKRKANSEHMAAKPSKQEERRAQFASFLDSIKDETDE